MIIWITGLSGSGKSSLAKEIVKLFRSQGKNVALLDGDELRKVFNININKKQKHTREERLKLSKQYSSLCNFLSKQGLDVVIATISFFKEIHEWNRKNLKDYFEVYLKVPLSELKKRDKKGIYKKYDSGKINNVVGLDIQLDEPKKPDLIFEFKKETKVIELANKLNNILKDKYEKK